MALVIPGFKEYLLQALSKSFVSYHSNLGEQMQHIIKNPFGHIENDRLRTVVLIVDALDECTDEALTKEFLTCIINASHYLPIKIFVTSRPERHIRAQFLSLSPEYRVLRLHEIDPGIVKTDISTYLTNSLADVSRERSDLVPPDWPSAEDVRRLVDRAGSLFIYAFTAVKYIGEDPVGNLQALFSTGCFAEMTNLEELYTQILTKSMTRKSREQVVTIRRILTAILVACKPLSIPTLSTWLDVDAYRIRSMLDQLHSVIRMPGDDDGTVSIFHASFGEFLTSSQHVPSDVRVLLSKGHCHFAKRCFKIMHSDLHFNVSQSLSSYQPTELLPDTSVVTSTTHDVPWQLQYACQYWLDHVIDASVAIQDVDSLLHHLELFLRKKLLYWIEALLAMGLLNNCIQMLMRSLGTPVLLQKMSPSLTSFLRDASEFVILSRDAIKHSPPHIYLSAIPFARPTSSVVHENALRFACLPLPNVRGLTRARVPILLLRAHSGAVNAVAVSPDGNYIASGAGDKSVCKWSSGTGELVDQLKGHTGEVLSIAYSPDASQIASGSSDCTIRIWDARTGECTLVITRHTASVMSVMFSNSGAQVISGSKDKTVLISNVQDGQPFLSPLEGHDEAVTCVAISRDGELIASGSEDCTIRLWNAKTGTPALQPLKGHDFAVQSVAFSPDGTRIISGSRDWRINVWNSSSGECLIAPLKEHSNNVNSVAFAPDDKHIASCSDDRTILVWDVDTGGLVMQPIVGHTDPVLSLAFSPDGKRLVSGSADRTISVWAVSNDDRPSNPLEGHTKAVYSVVFSSDGKRILSGSADRTVRIWDACTGKPVMKPLSGHTDDVNCAVFSKDGMQIASCADDHTIRIWNANSGEPDTTMPIITGHTQWVWSVEFSLDGKHIVSASKDKTVHIWDTATGKPVVSLLECHKHEVKWAVLSPDGKRIASASFDSTICVWSAETGELLLGPLTGHIGWIWALAYSSDGRRIASGGEDNKIRIWDAQTGELLWTLDGHTDDVFAVSFSPDSLFIVSGSADCTVCLWDVEKGALVGQPLLGHTDTVRCIAFAPNGRHAVSGSADTTIRVWDLYLVSAESLLRRTNEMVNSTSSALRLPGTSGWIRGPQGERRMWVLPEYRAFVHDKDLMPQCVLLIATGRVTVNFKDSVHGEEWTKCHVSEM
ncbi:hypothetical protein CPB85DRAFT_1340951 [Mucidula mucida]|nr:hypothetical protein CPB85DRAFT_1340951 [Mucidula mucida]